MTTITFVCDDIKAHMKVVKTSKRALMFNKRTE